MRAPLRDTGLLGRRGRARSGEIEKFSARTSVLYAVMLTIGSCSPTLVPRAPVAPAPAPAPRPPAPPAVENAVAAGVKAGPAVYALGVTPQSAAASLGAFKISCPSLLKREDVSGLTRAGDWQAACAAAETWQPANALSFFNTYFEAASIGDGRAFATGYFEPQIAGSRVQAPGYNMPVYRKPPDLVEVDAATAEAVGTLRRGRLVDGAIVPYHERSEIEAGALAGRGLEIAWAADEIDFFFLQIQGSGRLALPDGSVMRIGYAGQNGREYVGIGRLLKERGLLGPGQTSMQGIVAWLRANPEEGRAVMRENKSYIFFTELTGAGPLGALGKPVTPRTTVAADPKFIPLGAPVFLDVDKPVATGLWVAQDTGGAIKGANRVDTFWGAGEWAKQVAGGMQATGAAYVLLPRGTVARLDAGSSAAAQR